MSNPVVIKKLLNLTEVGIQASNINIKNVTFQSKKYVTILEENGDNSNWTPRISVVDIANKTLIPLPEIVDSAIMNPSTKEIALRKENKIRIYNLDTKETVKTLSVESKIDFWNWVDSETIGIVTKTEILHWRIKDDEPEMKFERDTCGGHVQLMSYKSSKDGKWLMLAGLSRKGGFMQVYSVDLKECQPTMNSTCGCFAEITLDSRSKPCNLFCFTLKLPGEKKIYVVETVDARVKREEQYQKIFDIQFPNNDMPIALHPDETYGLLWMLTIKGAIYLYEIQTGKEVWKKTSQNRNIGSADDIGGGLTVVDNSGGISDYKIDFMEYCILGPNSGN